MVLVHTYTHDGKDFTNRKHHHVESVLCWRERAGNFVRRRLRSFRPPPYLFGSWQVCADGTLVRSARVRRDGVRSRFYHSRCRLVCQSLPEVHDERVWVWQFFPKVCSVRSGKPVAREVLHVEGVVASLEEDDVSHSPPESRLECSSSLFPPTRRKNEPLATISRTPTPSCLVSRTPFHLAMSATVVPFCFASLPRLSPGPSTAYLSCQRQK